MSPVTTTMHAYLNLASTLAWREVVVRYKRSAFGVVWALADPMLHAVVYLLVFGQILDAGRGLAGYPLFMLLGVLAWIFFSTSVDNASGVLLEHAPLIRKLAFRTELLVTAVVVSRLATLLIGVAVALVLAFILSLAGVIEPAWERAPWLLLGVVLLTLFTTGLSLALSAVGVVFGDAQFLVRFALRIGFFACPVVYPLARVPEAVRPYYELNPLASLLWCFQAMSDRALPLPSSQSWLAAVLGSLLALVAGWWVFRRLRGVVAELV